MSTMELFLVVLFEFSYQLSYNILTFSRYVRLSQRLSPVCGSNASILAPSSRLRCNLLGAETVLDGSRSLLH